MELDSIKGILPGALAQAMERLDTTRIEELRLRCGNLPTVLISGREQPLPGVRTGITSRELAQILSAATQYSSYSAEDSLREGFVTLPGGHRIGLCGTAVTHAGQTASIRDLSSLCIRAARQVRPAIPEPVSALGVSTLILGPPGAGKTTLLRECVRRLSFQGRRVCVADERGEVAACYRGVPQLDVGPHTDVLTGARKDAAIMRLLRTMNPEWIALDEITAPEDIAAMEQASYCGVRFLATAHAACAGELQKRPLYRRLCALELFEILLVLTPDRQVRMERMR